MTKETNLPRGGGQSSQNSPFGVGRQGYFISSTSAVDIGLFSPRASKVLSSLLGKVAENSNSRQAMMQVPSTRKGLSSRSFSIKILEWIDLPLLHKEGSCASALSQSDPELELDFVGTKPAPDGQFESEADRSMNSKALSWRAVRHLFFSFS